MQYWLKRKDSIDADPDIINFFESTAGTAFLHRLVLGSHFAMTLLGANSVRQICQFFELTGLDQFIASSYGSQKKVSVQMEESIIKFSKEETSRLAKGMKRSQTHWINALLKLKQLHQMPVYQSAVSRK